MGDIIRDIDELTPVECYNGVFFKRDDLFMPYDIPISGGKVRQCIKLLESNKSVIEKQGATVATASSVSSPQGVIVATVANKMGYNSIIGVGGKVDFNKHSMLKFCEKEYNTELKILSGIAYTEQLHQKFLEYQKVKPFYIVKFGINLEDNATEIIDSIGDQVKNIPDDLDNLILPTGSGITASSILVGLKKHKKKVKRVIVNQISGNDRKKTINNIIFKQFGMFCKIPYEYIADGTHNYHKHIKYEIAPGFRLDPIYEGKSYDWLIKRSGINTDKEKTMFWVVGDSNLIRDKTKGY